MRFVVEALVEESDGLVPVHGEVRPARLFPNDDECLEFGFHFAAGLLQQFVSLDGEAFTDDADGVERAVYEPAFAEVLLRVFAYLDVGAVLLSCTFQTGGEVHGVTHHGVVLTHGGTHVSGHDVARVYTDAHVHIMDIY